jgi:predicted kinase
VTANPRQDWAKPVLVVICGLPATGKSTIGRAVARRAGAGYVRVDTIEQAIVRFDGAEETRQAVKHAVTWGLGYTVAYAVAGDLLAQGQHVFAECVNPMRITRDAWQDVATRYGAQFAEVELVCSDPAEHERRATSRTVDIPDLVLPTWQQIVDREYEPWDRDHVVLDTAGTAAEDSAAVLARMLGVD